ncbi:hypothetical protein [Brevibacillus sp. 179-C9.3 HS]|uniref:hypothetical protein n=1 Tax=unclassified Brevibacillus TaxID=2684853 RepID=UPI00399FB128
MAKRVHEKEGTIGLIADAQAEYEALMDEVHGYWEQAKELRKQATELKASRSTDSRTAVEISQLLERAKYIDQMGDEKEALPRLEILSRIHVLQREAEGLKETILFNHGVLERKEQELVEVEREATLMVKRAQESIQETKQLLVSQRAKLKELEGNRIE